MIACTLNIDISDRFERAIKALADALVMREKLRHEHAQGLERVTFSQTPDEQRAGGPEKDPTPAESEPVKESESQGVSDEAKAEEAPEPTRPSPTEGEKPQKKARAKAQKTAPEPTEATPEPTEATPEPTEVTPEPTEATPEPTEVTPEPTEATPEKAQEAAKNEDSMQGMNLMQAVKALTDELRARGVEMADANVRVRRRANELGLSYSSFTCLVKAIGYTDARRVVLGE